MYALALSTVIEMVAEQCDKCFLILSSMICLDRRWLCPLSVTLISYLRTGVSLTMCLFKYADTDIKLLFTSVVLVRSLNLSRFHFDIWCDFLNGGGGGSSRRKASTSTGQHVKEKPGQTSMPWARFEPRILASKRSRPSPPDRSTIAIGFCITYCLNSKL
jgi:hypothetical protein